MGSGSAFPGCWGSVQKPQGRDFPYLTGCEVCTAVSRCEFTAGSCSISPPFDEGAVLGSSRGGALSWRCSGRAGWAEYSHAIFLLCAFLIHFFSIPFVFPLFFFFWKLLRPQGEGKSIPDCPEAAPAAQQFAAGLRPGYKHILFAPQVRGSCLCNER